MSIFYVSNRSRPADNQTQRRNNRSQTVLNQFHGLQQDGYNRNPEYRDQHKRRPQRHDAVAYDPVVHRQYSQAYAQMASASPTVSQYGSHPHMARHDIDYQQHNSDYSEDSEGSSTAAVVGSRIADPVFAPPQPYHNLRAAAQAGDPYLQTARPQPRHEPPTDHGMTYSWTTGLVPEQHYGSSNQQGSLIQHPMAAQTNDPYTQPTQSQRQHEPLVNHGVPSSWIDGPSPGQYTRPSYQQGSHVQHPMAPRASAPFVPNPGPIPTQALFDPAQATNIHPPARYAPAPAFPSTDYAGAAVQPQSIIVPYAAAYQSYPPPPVNDPSGGLSTNNTVGQDQYPCVNDNENIVNPTPVSPVATRPPKENHRRNKRKEKKRA